MSKAMEIFADSYLKKLKRPELQREYNPDDSYGANMLFRSEETNPWAGRDQSNAKFGYLGNAGPKFQAPLQAPSMNMGTGMGALTDSGLLGQNANIPLLPSKERSAFSSLMEPVVGAGSKYASDAIMNWMKGPSTLAGLSPEMEGLAGKVLEGVPLSKVGDTMAGMGGGYGGIADMMTKDSTKALEDAIGGTVESAEGAATGAIPYAGTAMNLTKDLLTGKLLQKPAESLGSAGGTLAGAAAGSAIMPGIGTILGGLLGGTGGGWLGKLLGRIF